MGEQPKRHRWRTELLASDLTASAKVVGCSLADFANDRMAEAWPAVSTLETATRSSESTVQRGLRALEGAGWIIGEDRQGKPRKYTLQIPEGVSTLTPLGVAEMTPGGSTSDTPGVSAVTPGGSTSDTRTSKEQTFEPFIEPDSVPLAPARESADSRIDIDGRKGEDQIQQQEPQPSLPVASFSQRKLWNWPEDAAESIGQVADRDAARGYIFRAMQHLAGFTVTNTVDMGETFKPYLKGKRQFRETVEAKVSDQTWFDMAGLMVNGNLTKGDVANVLAAAGIEPFDIATLEARDAQAS